VRRVLERAVEIDALQAIRLTPRQLREIAIEAGISADAVELALAEVDRERSLPANTAAGPRRSSRWLTGLGGLMRSAVVGISGFGLGVIARALLGATSPAIDIEQLIAVIMLVFASTEFAFQHAAEGTHAGFQRDNAVLWASFASGWSAVHGYVRADLVSATSILCIACGIVGASIIAWRHGKGGEQPARD